MSEKGPIEAYLADLEIALIGVAWWKRRGLAAEVRAHLEDAADHERGAGAAPAEAERRAVDQFGDVAVFARQAREVHGSSWRRRGLAIGGVALIACVASVAVALHAGAGRSEPRIVRVEQVTVNLGNQHYRIVADATPNRLQVPLSELARWLPRQAPSPLTQQGPCPHRHLLITFTLSDGTAVRYGPCRIPAKVGVVRHNLALAYGRSGIALKIDKLRLEALQRQVIALPTQSRTFANDPLPVTGGSPDQRRLLNRALGRIPRRAWPAQSVAIRSQPGHRSALVVTIPSPPAGPSDNPRTTWRITLTRWAGTLALRTYNTAAHYRKLPRLEALAIDAAGKYSTVARAGTQHSHGTPRYSTRALTHAARRATHGTGLHLEYVAAVHLDGSHAYIELRTDDPWHASTQIENLTLSQRWRNHSAIVLTNPCAVPILIISATQRTTNYWIDPAWRAYSPGFGSFLGEPQTRPSTACG